MFVIVLCWKVSYTLKRVPFILKTLLHARSDHTPFSNDLPRVSLYAYSLRFCIYNVAIVGHMYIMCLGIWFPAIFWGIQVGRFLNCSDRKVISVWPIGMGLSPLVCGSSPNLHESGMLLTLGCPFFFQNGRFFTRVFNVCIVLLAFSTLGYICTKWLECLHNLSFFPKVRLPFQGFYIESMF